MNLLIGTLVSVALVEICLIASFFIDQNNSAEDENFGANAEEWPQGSELVFDSNEALRLGWVLHELIDANASVITTIGEVCMFNCQLGVFNVLVIREFDAFSVFTN